LALSINVHKISNYKKIFQEKGQRAAEIRIADLYKGQVLDLTAPVALSAAKISAEIKLSMADSIILATARDFQASLWTQDERFKDIPGVQYAKK
jgi:predicted nucleic acid-binding protein